MARDEDTTPDGSEVVYLSITVDPRRDTPTQLADCQKTTTNRHTLTGGSANIDALWSFLGEPPVTSRGQIPDSIYTFLSADGHQNVAAPQSTAWTEPQPRQVLAWLGRSGVDRPGPE